MKIKNLPINPDLTLSLFQCGTGEYLCLSQKSLKDGLLIRPGNANPVYYASDIMQARKVLDKYFEGEKNLQRFCKKDIRFRRQWDDMRDNGFFVQVSNATERPPMVAQIDGSNTDLASLLSLSLRVAKTTYHAALPDIRVASLSLLPSVLELIYEWYETEFCRNDICNSAPHTTVTVDWKNNDVLPGELEDLLDRGNCFLRFRFSAETIDSLKQSLDSLREFECKSGFFFPLVLHDLSSLLAESRWGALLDLITELLQDNLDRRIAIEIDPPSQSWLQSDMLQHYKTLTGFMQELYNIDADVAQIDLIGKYIARVVGGISSCRSLPLRLNVRSISAYIDTGYPLVVDNTEENLMAMISRLESGLYSMSDCGICGDCPLDPVCPKSALSQRISSEDPITGTEFAQQVLLAECAIHKKIFSSVFLDLLALCRRSLPNACALRLQISDGGTVTYEKAYPA